MLTLDELLTHPDQPSKDCVVDFETKTIREVRDVIASEGLSAGYRYADKYPHPRLWKLLAQVRKAVWLLKVALHCIIFMGSNLQFFSC